MKYINYILILSFFFACSPKEKNDLKSILEKAGKNKKELETVLKYYKDDSLKLKAALFLIENMPYHFSIEEYFLSPNGVKYRPDLKKFNNEASMRKHCDSLLKHNYKIYRKKKSDIQTLDSKFLIDNIDLAFIVWQKPWAKNITFTDFCQFILPYRVQTEETSNLRREIMERFLPLLDSANVHTSLEASSILNMRLRELIMYKETGSPLYPTIEETYYSGVSQCDGLCNLGAFIMRAVGIPVTVDQTVWVKMDLGHSWCVVLDNKKFYSMDPGGQQPILHAQDFSNVRHLRPAKVYRYRFDPDLSSRANTIDDGYTTFLKNPLIYDVTDEYLDKPIELQISIDSKKRINKKSELTYLCVFNFYEWRPLAIGFRDNSLCYFHKTVGDNIFIVADSPDGANLRYITAPFYVDLSGKIHKFIPDKTKTQTFTLSKRPQKREKAHTLHYWDTQEERFIPIMYTNCSDSTQTYNQIPKNALLWFTIPERIVNQRVFFIKNDSIVTY